MAYSYIKVSAAAGQSSVPFDFDYLKSSEIKVSINDVEVTNWSLSSPNVIAFDTPLAGGSVVEVERVTNLTTRAVDFSSGAVLTEEDLDLSAQQVFNAAQEALDSTEKNLSEDYRGQYDAKGKKITGVAKGTEPSDVINKAQLDYDYPAVKHVSDNMGDVNVLADNMVDINRVEDSIDNLDRVHTSIDKVDRVHTSIDKVDRVHTSIDKVDRVHTSITNVDRVHTSIDNLDRVDLSIDKLDRVHTSIDELDRVHTSIAKIDTVEADIVRIDTVADNITDVNDVALNMADINEVQDNLVAVNTVSDNVADVNTVADNITDVNTIVANLNDIQEIADELNLKITTEIGVLRDFSKPSSQYILDLGTYTTKHSLIEVNDKITVANVAQELMVEEVRRETGNITVVYASATGTNTNTLNAFLQAAINNSAVYVETSAIEAVAAVKEEVAALGPVALSLANIDSRYNDYMTAIANASDISTVARNINAVFNVYSQLPTIINVELMEDRLTTVNDNISSVVTTAVNIEDVNTVAADIAIIQDASTTLDAVNTSMIQMATAFTNSQTRYVEQHAFE